MAVVSKAMSKHEERRKRGKELLKKYQSSGSNQYAAAADAIADILLGVAEDPDEAAQIISAAEEDFRCTLEAEGFVAEG